MPRPHLKNGTTDLAEHCLRVPARHYLSREQLSREVDALFRNQPLLVGLTPDAPTPGSYFTHEAADTGLIIVRGDDNQVRAFVNACRHRGTRIAEGRGAKTYVLVPVPRLELCARRQADLAAEQLRRLRRDRR